MKPFNILKKKQQKLLGATGGGLNFHAESPCGCVFFLGSKTWMKTWGGRNEKFFSQKVELKNMIPGIPTTIKIMVDPISMIKTLRVQQWWLY